MAEQIIKNEYLTVTAKTMGAELISVKNNDGTEFMWSADPEIWGFHAPILFPVCGGLKNDKFSYKGKEYRLEKHGYARLSEFELEKADENSMTFILRSDAESKEVYPFDYEFRVTYTLDKNSIVVTYDVLNLTDGEMYTNVGAHEAYACPGGIEGYSVVFDEKENLDCCGLEGNFFTYETTSFGENTNTLELKDDFFAVDALSFLTLKSRGVTLAQNNGKRRIRVEFKDFPYMLLWTKYKAPYLCIEPWTGIPDRIDSTGDITEKEGIVEIEKGERFKAVHVLTFED